MNYLLSQFTAFQDATLSEQGDHCGSVIHENPDDINGVNQFLANKLQKTDLSEALAK